jgi:nitrite reductase/ring-hydroxylating ferredoxin subunit
MNSFQNQNTQPIIQMEIFNNWNIVTKGWYIVCPSIKLSKGKAKSFTICGQRIVIFRGEDGKIRALDAYCPHLGTDLGIGRVEGNLIRCFFHHWAFDGAGNCQHIPCQSTIPEKAKLQAYATDEKYGFIWIYPDIKATSTCPGKSKVINNASSNCCKYWGERVPRTRKNRVLARARTCSAIATESRSKPPSGAIINTWLG